MRSWMTRARHRLHGTYEEGDTVTVFAIRRVQRAPIRAYTEDIVGCGDDWFHGHQPNGSHAGDDQGRQSYYEFMSPRPVTVSRQQSIILNVHGDAEECRRELQRANEWAARTLR